MKKAYRHLVAYAIKNGYSISVWDGEEWAVKRSKKVLAINEAIESVEEAQLVIRDSARNKVARVSVIPFGMEPDETISDYSDNAFMAAWAAAYESA